MHDPLDQTAPESPAAIEREIAQTRAQLGATMSAIEDRLSPEHLVEQAMTYLREEVGEWGAEVGTFVRHNPLPVAVIGVGLGWLAYSLLRGRADARLEYGGAPEGLYGPHEDELIEESDPYAADYVRQRAGRVQRAAAAAVDNARAEMSERTHEAGNRAGEFARDARHQFDELADNARHFAEDTRERFSHAASETWEAAERVGHYARDGVDRLQHEVVRAADERPFLLGALGIGIGALVALCLPSTRVESRLVGRQRDEILDDMREAGRERLHGVVQAVRQAGEAARDQAEEEGLSRRGISDTLDRVQRVAETALDTAANEAEAKVLGTEEARRTATKNGKAADDKEAGPAAKA